MKNYWIYNRWFDVTWILSPPIAIWLIVLLFPEQLKEIEQTYSFWTWLILIVFIDVAHVYASVFRSYLVKEKWKQHRPLFILLPISCFLLSVLLYAMGSSVFWSVLAYIAVFHFIRQQFGFMRLYSRKEVLSKLEKQLDALAIYNATIYPMLYWFIHPERNFTWFMENEFIPLTIPFLDSILYYLYFIIILVYGAYLVFYRNRNGGVNYQKLTLIAGTYLSWYFGIVYFNNELIFTLLNVVSHGIPYMALVYVTEFKQKSHDFIILGIVKRAAIVLFAGILLTLALLEEFTWEALVWKEQVSWGDFHMNELWVVPLLALPQFVHYILDAFIWKRNY